MTKEKKTFEGKIDGVSEVTETKKEDLTPEDLDNIRAIANVFMAEDGRKSRG